MKALLPLLLLAACITMAAGCADRNAPSSSSTPSVSSSIPMSSSSSAPSLAPSSSMPSSMPSSSGIISDLGEAASDTASDLEKAVTPTLSADFTEIGALDDKAVLWGPGTLVDSDTNRTTASEGFQSTYEKYGCWFIAPKDTGKFYFTFDCGYESGETSKILDILKENEVQAVFFITGHYARSTPDLVQRMLDEGHIVGNHSNGHKNPTTNSLDDVAADMRELHSYVQETFDYEMFLYRPPEGTFSEQTLAMAQQMGYTTLLWSFAYADWDPKNQMGPEAALARTTRFIHEGAIYLMHTTGTDNTAILGDLIQSVRAKGLTPTRFDLYPRQ